MGSKNQKKLFLFTIISFVWVSFLGLVLWGFKISFRSPEGQFILAIPYMLSPAIITLIFHRFRFAEIAEVYGLHPKKLQYKKIFSITLLFLISYYFIYIMLSLFLGSIPGLESFGHLSFDKQEIIQETMKHGKVIPPEQFPEAWMILTGGVVGTIVAGFTINMAFALGEEIGWRGFMQKELSDLGFFKSTIITGIIWGLWHAPLVLQGYNYPEAPIAGVGYMVLLAIALSFPLADFRRQTGTVFTPAILHGMFNASGFLSILVVGKTTPYGGFLGMTGWVSILLAWRMTNEIRDQFRR